jgi:hypothetical protein
MWVDSKGTVTAYQPWLRIVVGGRSATVGDFSMPIPDDLHVQRPHFAIVESALLREAHGPRLLA